MHGEQSNEQPKDISLPNNDVAEARSTKDQPGTDLAEAKRLRQWEKELEAHASSIASSQKALEKHAEEVEFQQKVTQEQEATLRQREKIFFEEKEKLRQREQCIVDAELRRDAGWTDERASLDQEISVMRSKAQEEANQARCSLRKEIADKTGTLFADLEKEIDSLHTQRLASLAESENKERERLKKELQAKSERFRSEIEAERKEWHATREAQQNNIKKQREDNERKTGEISAKEDVLFGKEHELECAERHLEEQRDALEEAVERRIVERKDSFQIMEREHRDEIARLRECLQIQTSLLDSFEDLKRQLGNIDPAEVICSLNVKTDELSRLREELASRPSDEMRSRFDVLEGENQRLLAQFKFLERDRQEVESQLREVQNFRFKNSELEMENRSLKQTMELSEASANEARAELRRLRAAYEQPQEIGERYEQLEKPAHISRKKIGSPPKRTDVDEIVWLDGIGKACSHYGLKFPERILKAFHTALKTAEWSPLTILAGVSGTGKSELPRLYSHFGGILFEPLSVQPNWDSQESMLGFFNSIDNKFDAQPVLRFFAQSQKEWTEEYPGLREAVCMVLLDEMNLAHPELYFAEFLSKLETRRGLKGDDAPKLAVKVGAGLPPYQLSLGRNVLWTGTMNQDETTKSLSDKVLDRSIIIYFPRPVELKRRLELKTLDDTNRSPLLHRLTWQSWWAKGSDFSDKEIKPYKNFLETMNTSLAVVGRALGHRIWQSVEYYMANYPDVRKAKDPGGDKDALEKALHVAFEDQLVQKVMPKLRGIDTRGKGKTDCLDKIKGQIVTGIGGNAFNLSEDFELAQELGYGQFIWQSASYIKEEETHSLDQEETRQ